MSIESLKQQARKHEQKEEWQKALDQYQKALTELSQDDQTDIGLINRVGDLYVRVGGLDQAVDHYEQAVDLYREAFLPNNAIAVCKKIIRNVPDRHQAYLKIGQIRAEQGFLPDARTNFLTYAERMQQAGDLDESFRALVEFCDLAPDDVEVRITVAEQMAANERGDDAVEQLTVAYRHLAQSGESDLAGGVEKKILELDPEADLGAIMAMAEAGMGSSIGQDGEIEADFGEIELGGGGFGEKAEAEFDRVFSGAEDSDSEEPAGFADVSDDTEDPAEASASVEEALEEESSELPGIALEDEAEEDEGDAFELPTMDFGESDEAESEELEGAELPTMDFGEGDGDEEEAVELPTMDFGEDGDGDEEEAAELPTMDFGEDTDAAEDVSADFALEGAEEAAEEAPAPGDLDEEGDPAGLVDPFAAEEVAPPDAAATVEAEIPETDFGAVEPEIDEPAAAIEEAVEESAAELPAVETEVEAPVAEPPPAPPAEPAAPSGGGGDYVDLGAMILGGDEEKSTRFQVAYEEPSGDEEADFAKMLSQFKEKVSENLDSGDVRAHYDLGTAYKEMGLLEEAISSFQAALRASAQHLPTYELMGQTFIEMGQAEAAVKALQRALEVQTGVEDEFVGIYYYLARAYEALDEKDSAVEFYDRVFALDINFADVTERLRELR